MIVAHHSGMMHNRFHRCMFENLLLSIEQQSKPDHQLLNKFVDPATKLMRRADQLLDSLPTEKRKWFLDELQKLLRKKAAEQKGC